MWSLTLLPTGPDIFVINLQPPSFFGGIPTGLHLRLDKGGG
jgi:hypothetical protein